MGLITCPDCSKEVSDKAAACPNCGSPINKLNQSSSTEPAKVVDINASGFMGKSGTGFHAANVGCAAFLIGIAVIIIGFILVAF